MFRSVVARRLLALRVFPGVIRRADACHFPYTGARLDAHCYAGAYEYADGRCCRNSAPSGYLRSDGEFRLLPLRP